MHRFTLSHNPKQHGIQIIQLTTLLFPLKMIGWLTPGWKGQRRSWGTLPGRQVPGGPMNRRGGDIMPLKSSSFVSGQVGITTVKMSSIFRQLLVRSGRGTTTLHRHTDWAPVPRVRGDGRWRPSAVHAERALPPLSIAQRPVLGRGAVSLCVQR